jgi:two-component system OmpR family sensor kinase
MMRLGVRVRFALLTALLVLVVGALVAAAGYVAMRRSLLGQAEAQARDQGRQLAALIEVPGAPPPRDTAGNLVDIEDPSLSHGFARAGLLVLVGKPDGRVVQASRGARVLRASPALRARCLGTGEAAARQDHPPVAILCRRVGRAGAAKGLLFVGAPLRDALDSLARLREALAIGLAAGVALAALVALVVAGRALRPARRIAETAESIRSGDLSRRIDYRGPADELGALAQLLDSCFAALEQAVERERRFVADASHELKTPIAAMRAHIELLRRWAATEPAAREAALGSLDQAARRMGRLVVDLLYLTELDRAPPTARLPVHLDDVLLAVVAEAQPLRPDVPIRVRRLDDAVVTGDALRLQQLVLNLLDNALRVSAEDGQIDVAVGTDGAGATLTVTDRGPGIPPDRLERIFDRFYSAPGGSTTAPGTGLGLAIAREIARAHGGELTAHNEPGGGATLRLALPGRGASPNLHATLIAPSPRERTVAMTNDQPTGGR